MKIWRRWRREQKPPVIHVHVGQVTDPAAAGREIARMLNAAARSGTRLRRDIIQ